MKAKRIKITIGKSYVEIDLEFEDAELQDGDESPEMIANYAMLAAYQTGEIGIDIADIDPAELPISNSLH